MIVPTPDPQRTAASRADAARGFAGVLRLVLVVLFFLVGLGFLLLREVVLPRADEYRPQIVQALEQAIGLPVAIDALSADWQGLRPRLHLTGLSVLDAEGQTALRLERVDATLAWSSLARAEIHFHRLLILAPELSVRREAGGAVYVAGVRIDPGASGSGFSDWLLRQRQIVVRGAALRWTDHQRGAPALSLDHVDLRLSRVGARHRFGFRARPPEGLAKLIDLRGDLVSAAPAEPRSWEGQLYLALDGADLAAWQPWLAEPFLLEGTGALRAWAEIRSGALEALALDVALDDARVRLAENLPEWLLDGVRGRMEARRSADGIALSARGVELVSGAHLRLPPTDVDLFLQGARTEGGLQPGDGGKLTLGAIDLGVAGRIARHLPLAGGLRDTLDGIAPQGSLDAFRFEWQGAVEQPRGWSVHARLSRLGTQPHGQIPGIAGFAAEFDGSHERGRFRLTGRDAALEMPHVFPEPLLQLSSLSAEGGWVRRDGRTEWVLDGAQFENPDAAGSASGVYRTAPAGLGEIDLSARLVRADGLAVWRYLPRVVNEETRSWLRRSLTGGTAPESRLRLKGNLDDFPFTDRPDGQFLVTVQVAGARLDYAPGWPSIRDINGELRFEGAGMRILAETGRIFGVRLEKVVAEVPDLDARDGPVMTIRGCAEGSTAEFLKFVSESPVAARIDHFTDGMRAEGNGALDLELVLPLAAIESARVRGEYQFSGNRLTVLDGLPPLAQARGRLRFTENDLTMTDASARLFGEPLRVSVRTPAGGGVRFLAEGGAAVRAVRETYGWPILDHLSGTLPWSAEIDIGASRAGVLFRSNLDGVSSSLPAPFNKRAGEGWPLIFSFDRDRSTGKETIRARLRDLLEMDLAGRRAGDGTFELVRGGVGLFAPVRGLDGGVLVTASLPEIDLDAWRRTLTSGNGSAENGRDGPWAWTGLLGVDLRIARLQAFGQSFEALELDAVGTAEGWRGRVSSARVEGEFDWRGAGAGALRARLRHLAIDREDEAVNVQAASAEADEPRQLPALDVVADRFRLRGMELGRLTLEAHNAGGLWRLDTLSLEGPDGRFSGAGQWRPGRAPRTELKFELHAASLGGLLDRLGYEGVMEAGGAGMKGWIAWGGAPTRLHHASLSGAIEFEAKQGQFRQLKPGVGRLLGVLSLQSLPRRLSLDFRDVFSEGFVFDRISGSIEMESGVMNTQDLHIAGPAARIWITGSADVDRETQDLKVLVQPTLSESVAIGAAAGMINPLAGVVTYLAQKVLSDPIERMFAYQYLITGNWSDPKVEKVIGAGTVGPAVAPAAPAAPALPASEGGR
jgi:uncharacterized protein (TIGR02099 family)